MREFLKSKNLSPEDINEIMAEIGKGYAKLKGQVKEYETKASDYENQIKELNEKMQSNAKNLENLQNITNENNDLKAQVQMNESNVKKEFSKFVRSEVMANVNDETDFVTALENYKSANPQYFGETKVVKTQSSPVLAGGVQPQSTNDIMNNIIRGQ